MTKFLSFSPERVYKMDGKSYYFPRLRWLNTKEIGMQSIRRQVKTPKKILPKFWRIFFK